ncbi:MAG TPA: LacI family DNA-binding transcriptional regulator [Phototrophicaceae bacterium]|nr:LacI family DNA-binding transcriptional regulator [Phototrophicaceae bacterium]
MKRPTQEDVARAAGVSRSTVSYVLNDQTAMKIPISDETRQRVMQAIADLGYEPDARAQALTRGSTKTIGVIIPVIENPYFWQIFSGVSDALLEAGYSLHLSRQPRNSEQEINTIRELTRHRVDGFILLASVKYLLPQLTDDLRKSGQPVVEITATKAEFDQVIHDYSSGTRALMEHLLELGHQRIGFIYGVTQEVQGLDRLGTYRQVLREAGLSGNEAYEMHCGDQMAEAYQAAYTLLSRPNRPTALLVINDLLAIAVMRAAGDLGLSIPGDLSVAGFDDIPFSSYTMPRLTTVSGMAEASGRDAVRLLLRRIAEPDLPQQVTTARVQLMIRESTGRAAPAEQG